MSPPYFRQCIALFAVTEDWLLLDIGLFVLFFHISPFMNLAFDPEVKRIHPVTKSNTIVLFD